MLRFIGITFSLALSLSYFTTLGAGFTVKKFCYSFVKHSNKKVDSIANPTVTVSNNQISVKKYGATGNGKVDDYLAIKHAINSGFKNIYFPKGVYRVTQEIQLPSNVRLFGDGYKTIIKFNRVNDNGNHQSGYVLYGVDIENTTVENIKIDCSLTKVIIAAVRFEGGRKLNLTNVWLDKPYNGGIQFGGPQFFGGIKVSEDCIAKKCKVTNVQSYNQSTGYACFIAAGGSKNCIFQDCVVQSNICDAYSSDFAYDTKFIRCSFLGSAGGGFTAEGEQVGTPRNVFYESCTANLNGKAGTGWFISENTNAILHNCTVKNVSGTSVTAGMFLQNMNTTITNSKFYNIKTPTGGYGGGALFSQSKGIVKVKNSTFWNNTFDLTNYNAGSGLTTLEFEGCTFNSPVNSYFASGKYDVTYNNCTFKSPVVHALQRISSKASYTNCKFYSTLEQGLNGIDYINISGCSFFAGTNNLNGNHTKTAIKIAGGSPNDAIKIENTSFYGFADVVSFTGTEEPKFSNCKFISCLNIPKQYPK